MQTPLLLVTLAVLAMHIHPSGGSECQSKGEDQDPLLLPEFMRNPPLQRPPRLPRTLHFAVIGPNSSTHKYNLLNVVPAIEMARRRIYDRQLLPGLDIKILSKDSECQSVYSGLASFYFYYENTADVFFGPICDDYTLAPVARYAAKWNIPVLTPGGQAPGFTCKRDYELLTRMLGSYSQVGEFFRHVTSRWNWKTLSLVYENTATSGNSPCYFMMEAVFKALGKVPHHRQIYPTTESKHVLLNVTQEARIVVLCASPDRVRSILLAAEELKMMEKGEYVFFNVELFLRSGLEYKPWFDPNDEKNNERAKQAYEAVLTVTARTPTTPEYKNFSDMVKNLTVERSGMEYEEDTVNTFVAAFHDAVLLYAHALNETLREGGDVTNGSDITRRMWNRSIEGITGTVSIDENGDRKADYSLLDMDPKTGVFHVVANYFGVTGELKDVEGKSIHWAGGRDSPPPDTPQCGFDGSLCPDKTFPNYAIVIIVLGAFVILLCVASFFIYRHYKLEAELASMTWKVTWSDILDPNFSGNSERKGGKRTGGGGTGSRLSLSPSLISADTVAWEEMNKNYPSIKTGIYKGTIVAIKKIKKNRIDITRSLLLELKRMKDLHHDHLVRFIGACVDAPHCCILTEYCPKGSLEDILANDQIKLDWMFRYSLMHDIVKGMAYLHASEIRSHGNLKSSNCVVDSRFVLKVTDFGIHSLRQSDKGGSHSWNGDEDEEDTYAYWRNKFWTAPEILRMEEKRPPEGTQKGDVYSFAIIVHEISFREGPFFVDNDLLTPREIIENVKNGSKPPFRPTMSEDVSDEEVLRLMRRCWAEEAFERPDFQELKGTIRKLNKENESGNILDNLLSRMEQYANNLEALVEERTADYLEEKRRCEELLYQLLPKSVASQLINGQSVVAETYESVTIYFSDIVGFTALSAESTPMEVVDLLNDLYTCFDGIIENFDVYKVETIGDAYMVVSGLPVRNGKAHAREIARMSLALLENTQRFRIRHRPTEQLKLRIGLHTGPVCAGVVGLKMPRYCLFGDTVNTASRMESNGLPLMIHVSPKTKEVLDIFKTFRVQLRGEVEMKGKGKMTTYWLLGEEDPLEGPPLQNSLKENCINALDLEKAKESRM